MNRKKRNYDYTDLEQYYNYGAEAYEYYPEDDEYNAPIKRTSRVQRRKNRKKANAKHSSSAKAKPVKKQPTHYEFVKEKTTNFKVYFSIGTLFVFFLVFVCMFAVNNKKENEINSNIAELKKLEQSNSVLQTEVNKNVNLEEIEKIAKTKLNMQKPAPHQIVYINIPKQSYTVQYNLPEDDEEENELVKIWNNLFGD